MFTLDRQSGKTAEDEMIRRWCVYLTVLAGCFGLYVALPGWFMWIAVLTTAGSPLISVILSAFLGEKDALGLFRFSSKRKVEYDLELRPFRPGDSISRVLWKRTAKSGEWFVREAREILLPEKRKIRGILPVALCFVIMVCAFPLRRYDRQMQILQEFLKRKPEVRLDLTAQPQEKSKQPILDVVASESQRLYLRGQSFDVYDGISWCAAEPEEWSIWKPEGTVSVEARTNKTLVVYDGAAEKPKKDCLQLPKETKVWAKALIDGKTVAQIGVFVRGCASYDENAVATGDVAQWLVESGRGYCVHFATTATVLLRAAGIPARFVTGYVVNLQAGIRKTVAGSDGHAWAEYWDGENWRILEATPTVEASVLPPAQKENRQFGGWWLVILALPLFFRKKKNGRLQELRQKAAFSRDGLSAEEKWEYEKLRQFLWHG